MHSASKRYDVYLARTAGVSPRQVVSLTGVPARSQRRILYEEIPFGMSDQELHQQRGVGRPTTLAVEFRELVREWLEQQPEIKVSELLRRLRSDHAYHGSKNPVYDFVGTARPRKAAPLPIVRFEGVAGEFAQHDFGTLTVKYLDGTQEKLTFFAARLKYSRALHVTLVAGESAEAFLRGLEAAATAWGGLPLLNVVDNTKAAVVRRRRDPDSGAVRIELNLHFASFLQEVGVLAEPTAPYSGNQKGSVENLVRFVKEGFLEARHFRNRADLERQLGEWLQYANEVRPCDATGIIPAVRLREELPRLKPLPSLPHGYGLLYHAVARPDGRVRWGGHGYSVPHGWIGQALAVRVHQDVVVLHHEGQQCVHPRTPANGRYSLLPEHLPALFKKPRGKIMAQRQILMDLCPEGEAFFTELVHRRPDTWRAQDLPVVWALYERVGHDQMTGALRHCMGQATFGAEYLRAHLDGWAAQPLGVAA